MKKNNNNKNTQSNNNFLTYICINKLYRHYLKIPLRLADGKSTAKSNITILTINTQKQRMNQSRTKPTLFHKPENTTTQTQLHQVMRITIFHKAAFGRKKVQLNDNNHYTEHLT